MNNTNRPVKAGLRRDRVVAVIAVLPDGTEQVGSGYLVDGRLVLTAEHCTRDALAGGPARSVRVIRASDGQPAGVVDTVRSGSLDVAVLRLDDSAPWAPELPKPVYARVDRTRSGGLTDCHAIGYPLMQRDPDKRTRHTAEVHPTIYQTDEAEPGRLLMREPLIRPGPVTDPDAVAFSGRKAPSPWGGLSGALVFYRRLAIGVVIEHHPRQGDSALQVMAFDTIASKAATDDSARRVAQALGLPALEHQPWATTTPADVAAQAQLDRASALSEKGEFAAAARACETAINLAIECQNAQLQSQAHLRASHTQGRRLANEQIDDRARGRLLAKMLKHIDAAESLHADPLDVASERLLHARLSESPQEILRRADELNRIKLTAPEPDSSGVDVIQAQIEALMMIGRPDEAFALDNEVERLRSKVSASERLSLDTTWVQLHLAYGAENTIPAEVASYTASVREIVGRGDFSRAEAVRLLRDVAEQAHHQERLAEAITLMLGAYEIAGTAGGPPMPRAMMARQLAEYEAQAGNAPATRRYLGEAELWWEREARTPPTVGDLATVRAKVLYNRGQTLALLAQHGQGDQASIEHAVTDAYEALAAARTQAEENRAALAAELDVDVFLANIAYSLGGLAQELGEFAEAAAWFESVRTDAAMADARFAFHCGMPAWLREAESMRLAGRVREARQVVGRLLTDIGGDHVPEEVSARAQEFQRYLDEQEIPIIDWLESPEATVTRRPGQAEPLRVSVAAAVSELVSWWERSRGKDYRSLLTSAGDLMVRSELRSILMDVWGRGGFLKVVAAIRDRSNPAAAIAVDAWTVPEIARWARILCPLFDTVIVRWKGDLGAEVATVMFPDEEFSGGDGYYWASTPKRLRRQGFALGTGWANPVPKELGGFLSGPALALVRAGRLIVLPAALVGCTQTRVGWTDDLFVGGLLNGVVNVGRRPGKRPGAPATAQRVLDLSTVNLPYIDGVTMPDLAAVLDEAADSTSLLRTSFLKALNGDDLKCENWAGMGTIASEIAEACRYLQEKLENIARTNKKGTWQIAHARGVMSAGSRPSANPGHEPVTDVLRSIGSLPSEVAPWVPYWLLERRGGQLDWTAPLDNSASQPDPVSAAELPEGLFSWLRPPTGGGLRLRAVRYVEVPRGGEEEEFDSLRDQPLPR